MTDPSQTCPPAWREHNTNKVRACGRPVSSSESCPATLYSVNQQYSRLCGRVIGYQVESPDGFFSFMQCMVLTEATWMVLVSPMEIHIIIFHIWNYVAGAYENHVDHTISNCPCSSAPGFGPRTSIIGSTFYCESGNPTDSFPAVRIFTNTNSGMGSSVKVPAAVVPSLPHGSVYSYPPKHLIGLRCVFVLMSPLAMKMS